MRGSGLVSAQDPAKDFRREIDLLYGHVEVRDGSETGAANGVDQDPFLFQRSDDRGRRKPTADHVEHHNVAVDVLRVDRDSWKLLQLSGEPLGIVVVILETADMVLQG